MIATERGDSSAWRSAARWHSASSASDFREAKRRGRRRIVRNFRGLPKPMPIRAVARHAKSHNNVRIGGIPILRVVAIVVRRGRSAARTIRGGDTCSNRSSFCPSRPRWSASACCAREPCARGRRSGQVSGRLRQGRAVHDGRSRRQQAVPRGLHQPGGARRGQEGRAAAGRHRDHAGAVSRQARRATATPRRTPTAASSRATCSPTR